MDTTNEWRVSPGAPPINEPLPCANGHSVDGVPAGKYDEILNGKTCDCKRVVFSWEPCTCDGGRSILKHKPVNG